MGYTLFMQRDLDLHAIAIRNAIKSAGITIATLEQRTRESADVWHNILKGRTKVRAEHLDQVRAALSLPSYWPSEGASDPTVLVSGLTTLVEVRASRTAIGRHSLRIHSLEPYIDMVSIPAAFLVGGVSKVSEYEAVIVSDKSMAPRLQPGDMLVLKRDQALYRDSIVLAVDQKGARCIRVLRDSESGWELVTLDGTERTDIAEWTVIGHGIGIIGDEHEPGRNMEFRFGRPLRA